MNRPHRRLATLAPLLALILTLTACGVDGLMPVYTEHPDGYDVRYEVISNCNAFVTLQGPTGVVQRAIGPSSSAEPYWYERGARAGDFLYVSAQLECYGGTITTRILKWYPYGSQGGDPGWYVWGQNTSSGDFAISTTSGSY